VKINLFFFLAVCLPFVMFSQDADTILEEMPDTSSYYYEEAEEDYLAAERAPYHPPALDPLASRKIEQNQWDEASNGLDYSNDLPKPPKEEKPRDLNFDPSFDWTSATQGLGSLFQALAVLVAIAAIAYGIWRMLEAPRNRLIDRDGVEITLDNLDEYLHETDLDRFLREALAQGNYALAVRLYYLQIIKSLSEKNAIKWSREKTNRDYLREMRGHPLAEQFREATRIYERVWYGNQPLSAGEYEELEPKMKGVLAGV
jgi:hypothetical protein